MFNDNIRLHTHTIDVVLISIVHSGHSSFKYRLFENNRLVPEYSFSLERYRCEKTNPPTVKKSTGCQPFDILRTKFMQSLNNCHFFPNIFFSNFVDHECNLFMRNWSNTMHICSVQWLVMSRCFRTGNGALEHNKFHRNVD